MDVLFTFFSKKKEKWSFQMCIQCLNNQKNGRIQSIITIRKQIWMTIVFILIFRVVKPFLIFLYIPFRHLNKINSQKRKERSYNRCNLTFLHTYLLFSNKMRPASAARTPTASFSLFTHRHLFCFIWLSNQKRKYKSENKNVRKLRTLLLKRIHIKYKKKEENDCYL